MANDDEDDDDGFDTMISDDFDEDGGDEEEGDTLVSLSTPSSILAVRRAIESRMEARQMNADLNYLELDFEDEE
ncbi:MAG TPA: hypothetical protein VLA56_06690 [Pseudomonadales bacterium]|nr:hypothetical protein [Pseudomonadales bacterium]